MRRPSVGAYVLFGLLTATQVWSQSAATSLRGSIADPTAAFVANAQVQIENKATELHQETTSDEKGQYQFQQITPGTYTISVTAPGFAAKSKIAELLVDQPAT